MPDSTAASDQGNRTSELDEALSNHENLCENQTQPCGDCRRLKATLQRLISQEAAKLARAAIDGVTLNEIIEAGIVPTPEEHKNMLGLLDVVRRRLDALQGGTEG